MFTWYTFFSVHFIFTLQHFMIRSQSPDPNLSDVGPGRTALASVAPGFTAAMDAVFSTSTRSR